jgi:hypothetical protein
MFKLTLSVSKTQTKTKTEGMSVTEFTKKEFDIVPDTDLKELFTTRLYSTNYWDKGKCGKRNYLGMYGMTMDVDKDMTLDAAKELFKEYNYIIHTSTSHKADIAEKGGIQDRFRIILPADPADYNKYADVKTAQALYAVIIKKHPFVDSACAEPARKYFPFLNSQYPQLYEQHINDTGKYYSVPVSEIKAMEVAVATAKVASKPAPKGMNLVGPDEKFITWDMKVTLADKSGKVAIRDIKEHTPIFCPFCDDINSIGASAFVTFNAEGFPLISCSHCDSVTNNTGGRYYLPLNEKFNNLLYIENNMYWIRKKGKSISLGRMPEPYLNSLSQDDSRRLKHWVAKHLAFTSDEFKLQRIVDGYADELTWEWLDDGCTLEIRTPPIEVITKDNDYINSWLESMFGDYTEFFKDYLALYCYYNHKPLPVIVLSGPRNCGKTTIAEFMTNFFYGCHADWSGQEDQFNGYLEKRLLVVDEANVDKKEQYTKIKALSGRKDVKVNKKHKAEYQAINNVCIIMLTNEQVPMYLVNTEKPTDPAENQFFMMGMQKINKEINSGINEELRTRVGWYIRTELRARYENWKSQNVGKVNRYGIPVPITDFLNQQYDNARTSLDYECDTIFLACTSGAPMKDRLGNTIEIVGPFDVINTDDLHRLINATKVTNSNVKSFRERMQAHGYLKKTKTKKNGLDAWEVNANALLGTIHQTKGT